MAVLKDRGFIVSSHMAVASDDLIAASEKFFSQQESSQRASSKEVFVKQEEKKIQHEHEKALDNGSDTKNLETHRMPEDSRNKINKKADNAAIRTVPIKQQASEDTRLHKEYILEQDESGDLLKYQIDAQIGEGQITLPVKGHEFVEKLLQKTGIGRSVRRSGRRRRRMRSEQVVQESTPVTQVVLQKDLPLVEVATLLGKGVGEVILALLKKGAVYNKNSMVPIDVIEQLAQSFGIQSEKSKKPEVTNLFSSQKKAVVAVSKTSRLRWPVVVVMGHVDHGKTTLLDYIRKMNVAAGERGGITQHLGAYEVDSQHGKVVFIDTPGHEAFSYIRQRGSRITDIAILVIAADDGVKPQTIEAIKHAQAAQVPIIVAINKVDKVSSPTPLETVKRQLAQQGLMPEDWGGDVVCVPISAKTGQGIDTLLEMIILQSQLMDLHEEPGAKTKAFVLESYQERGLGSVATVICSSGTLRVGDYFICGEASGKVRVLVNSSGKRIEQAGVSIPVRVVGFDAAAPMGDWLEVVSREEYLSAKSNRGQRAPEQRQEQGIRTFFAQEKDSKSDRVINLIIKTDTRGSLEALTSSIDSLVKKHKKIGCPINILSQGIGDITENDLEFALSTGAELVGLHVRVEKNAVLLAKDREKTIYLFGIIYELIDALEKMLIAKKEVVKTWNKVGKAVVRKVFAIKGLGVIAGCYLQEGVVSRNCKVACIRNGVMIAESKITSLQRDKKHVKEVHAGFEFGFIAEGFEDWQEQDEVICSLEVVQDS